MIVIVHFCKPFNILGIEGKPMESSMVDDWRRIILWSFILFWIKLGNVGAQNQATLTDQLLPETYNAQMRPNTGEGKSSLFVMMCNSNVPATSNTGPINVSLSVIVNKINSLSELTQSITLNLYILQSWSDPRLQVQVLPRNTIIRDAQQMSRYWMPDTTLIGGSSVTVLNTIRPALKLTITTEGRMELMMRVNAQLGCFMNLQNYPHDIQYCRIRVTSCK